MGSYVQNLMRAMTNAPPINRHVKTYQERTTMYQRAWDRLPKGGIRIDGFDGDEQHNSGRTTRYGRH